MIAKLIVWDVDRLAAVRRLGIMLGETHVIGLRSNLEFLREIAGHTAFAAAQLDTGFIPRHHGDLLKPDPDIPDETVLLCALGHLLHRRNHNDHSKTPSALHSPWDLRNGWRMNSDGIETMNLVALGRERDQPRTVKVLHRGGCWWLETGSSGLVQVRGELSGNKLSADLDGRRLTVRWFDRDSTISVIDARSKEWRFKFAGTEAFADAGTAAGGQIKAPMPGRVIAVFVEPGTRITSGQPLLVVEAMKMEHSLRAPRDGVVASVACKAGDQVEEGRELVVLEA